MKITTVVLLLGSLSVMSANADPEISSWFTSESTKYARVMASKTANSTGTVTWTYQTSPVYAGIQEVAYDANYVYARSYGMAGYVMGPWYLDAAKTQAFPNWPEARTNIWRFTRSPTVAPTKTLTTLGAIGLYVNGVSLFDNRDGYVWTGSGDSGNGTGYWYRDAWINEGITFDSGYAHQEQTGNYHYHAYPPALRYQLGDNITLSNGVSVEVSSNLTHSPILAWVGDGFPLYGPYGYSDPTNATSGVRRMVSGYVLRDGQNGTDNLATNGAARLTIPAWAQRAYNVSANQTGPTVSTNYPVGRYLEDKAYLGDLTNSVTRQPYQQGVDFDLNEYNARWCVTPEYPGGTWAYFCTLTSSNTPAFPYAVGRQFLGTPYTTTLSAIPTNVVTAFKGGPDAVETMNSPSIGGADVTIVWNSIEGGTYTVQASSDLSNSNNWTALSTNIAANVGTMTSVIETGAAASTQRFYRVARGSLAPYWPAVVAGGGGGTDAGISSISPTSGNRGQSVGMTITLDNSYSPPPPPNNIQPTGATLTGPTTITGTSVTRNTTTGIVSATFNVNGVPPGTYTVNVVFSTPMGTLTLSNTGGFTVN